MSYLVTKVVLINEDIYTVGSLLPKAARRTRMITEMIAHDWGVAITCFDDKVYTQLKIYATQIAYIDGQLVADKKKAPQNANKNLPKSSVQSSPTVQRKSSPKVSV